MFYCQRRKRTAKFLNYRGKFWTIFQCDDWLEWMAKQIKTVQEIRANADLVDSTSAEYGPRLEQILQYHGPWCKSSKQYIVESYTQTDFFLLVSSHNPYFQSKFQAWISVMHSCSGWLKQMRRNRVASQGFKHLVPVAPTPPKVAIIRHFNHKKKIHIKNCTLLRSVERWSDLDLTLVATNKKTGFTLALP